MAMLGEMPMAEVRRKLWRIKTRGKCGVSLHDATDLRLSCHPPCWSGPRDYDDTVADPEVLVEIKELGLVSHRRDESIPFP